LTPGGISMRYSHGLWDGHVLRARHNGEEINLHSFNIKVTDFEKIQQLDLAESQ
jgi:hypothetical protein